MCGIAGCCGFGASASILSRMLKGMLHRGYSCYETGTPAANIYLGANRLEIVDRDGAVQPMVSHDGRYHVVFNGEIVNFLDIREELQEKGISFRTSSDTEVIANGLMVWSLHELVKKLNGMFAFVTWDRKQNCLQMVRDRLGIKPLYFAKYCDNFYFASELKGLIGTVPGYAIRCLEPGTISTWHSGDITENTYYKLPEELPCIALDSTIAMSPDDLRRLISSTIEDWTATDLPLAVLLSGGIDSSIILYETLKYHKNVSPFVIGSNEAEDVVVSKRLCADLGIALTHLPISVSQIPDFIEDTVLAIESFESNLIRAGLLSYLIAKEIHDQGFRVALCGEGADELFCGYDEFMLAQENGMSEQKIHQMQLRFLRDLHRSQMQRVDRTGMAHTVEIRPPFLDMRVVEAALALPLGAKLRQLPNGAWSNKWILREAYRGILPDYVVNRTKCVLSKGAGLGANRPEGPFYAFANDHISDAELAQMQQNYPDFLLKTREDGYYFKIFNNAFPGVTVGLPRLVVTKT